MVFITVSKDLCISRRQHGTRSPFALLLLGAGVDKARCQPGTGGQVVQGGSEDHRIANSNRRNTRVSCGALHATVSCVDVPGHGLGTAAGVHIMFC